jgi:hypothetical protein
VGSIRHQPGGADRQPDAWCAAASGGGGGNPRLTWKQIQRRYASEGTFQETGIAPFDPCSIGVTRYRYRGRAHPQPVDHRADRRPERPRTQRASREEQLSLERVQQALGRGTGGPARLTEAERLEGAYADRRTDGHGLVDATLLRTLFSGVTALGCVGRLGGAVVAWAGARLVGRGESNRRGGSPVGEPPGRRPEAPQ